MCGAAYSYWLMKVLVREMNDTAPTAGELQALKSGDWIIGQEDVE